MWYKSILNKALIIAMIGIVNSAFGQSVNDYFHSASQLYIFDKIPECKQTIAEALQKYPNDPKLKALKAKLKDEDKMKKPNKKNNQNKDNKDQQNKDKNKNQDKNQEQKNNQNQQQQNQPQQSDKLTKEDAKRMLEAIQNDEKNLEKKLEKEKFAGKKVKPGQDW